jgi:two-component system chemotaxis response regulator CheB
MNELEHVPDRPVEPIVQLGHDIVVVGASAGGVPAVRSLLAGLPRDLHATLLIVIHMSSRSKVLPAILASAGPLPVEASQDGAPIQRGRVYIASPDHHLALNNGFLQVVRGPRENRSRPSIDVLFRSAAKQYGPRVIGILLTGLLDDGTAGLAAIKRAGGIAIVQNPDDAEFPDMPRNALDAVDVDYCLPLAEISGIITRLTMPAASVEAAARPKGRPMEEDKWQAGEPSYYACPECGGVLRENDAGNVVTFRCHVGHAFSTQALLESQDDGLENALWAAVRILEEKAHFYRRMAHRHGTGRTPKFAESLGRQANEAEQYAATIRQILSDGIADKSEEPPGEFRASEPTNS